MEKPANPFRKNSKIWRLMEGDWATYTIDQIAAELNCDPDVVRRYIYRIKRETGYTICRRERR